MVLDYQAELQKIYFDTLEELDELDSEYTKEQREEFERYRDIADGIIII